VTRLDVVAAEPPFLIAVPARFATQVVAQSN
jgi:hypothetical protein